MVSLEETRENIARVKEELTIQRVILRSLDDSGVTDENVRQRVQQEITALKEQLRDLMICERHHVEYNSRVGSQTSNTMSAGTSNSASSSFHTDAGSSMSSNSTNTGGGGVARFKRELTSPSGSGRNKSRRSSPMTAPPPVLPSQVLANQPIEIIDLTGDDIQLDASLVADQIRRERQHTQSVEDRRFAEQLSQESSLYQPSSSQIDPNESFGALARIMETQRANAPRPPRPSPLEVEYPGYESISSGESSPSPSPIEMTSQMPGAWDAMPGSSRQRPINLSQPQSVRSLTNASNGTIAYRMPGTSGPVIWWPANAQPPPGFLPVNPASSQMPIRANRTVPSQGPGGALGNIINRTSMFGYGAMGDMMSSMGGRLGSFFESIQDERVSDEELAELLKNVQPDVHIPEDLRGKTKPEGLKNDLYHHQELALIWMKKMEDGTNKGGILADDMGLGKTISTLSLILDRKATSRPKTNLIIGPLSLIRQWEEEIKSKTKASHSLSVFVYHNKKATSDDLLQYDVVLTTYGTIAQEFKRLETYQRDNADRQIDYNDRAVGIKFPLLNPEKAIFHRIILDEAQCIKNKLTQTSKACHALRATYRWCLTGTPMMNGVLELYPLLRFLRIKPYHQWEKFRHSFGVLFGKQGDPKHKAMDGLRALLKAVMLRRKKDSLLDGKPILRLPPKTEEVVYAELSEDERGFYKQLEMKSQVLFSKYLREGTVGKNYSSILVLLLRLRQACCHPHLNLDVDDVSPYTDEDMVELVKKLDPTIVRRIKEMEAFECPICYDAVQSPTFFIPCGHDSCKQCLSRIADNAATQNLQEGTESSQAKCPVCRGPFDPRKCFTYEAFQEVHMPEALDQEDNNDEDDSDDEDDSSGDEIGDSEDEPDEPIVKDEVDKKGNLKGFIDDGFFDDDSDEDIKPDKDAESADAKVEETEDSKLPKEELEEKPMPEPKPKKKSKGKGKAKAKVKKNGKGKEKAKTSDVKPSTLKQLRKDAAKNKDSYRKYMAYLRETWMPAAKIDECMKLLHESDAEGEKTIIFSQWTLLLDLIDVAMYHEDFSHRPRRYDGSMSGELRAQAAKDFREKSDVRVMLVSLRAGNAGLNLTSATRVIIMDPFWNPYIEMQAVDRAYRIGQTKEVKVYRILTKDTVEDRIVALKEKKQEVVEAALDEKESAKIGRLNANELRFLFTGN
ncbi:hypothetical protein VHEMI04083 [[Torrubiella] hemipterigena]|uniref:SWI/SNF family DNA-dependent ATPase Ris1 n=1 Tax=[Torrubiella] hemipterigena TaxID=1531966 RepID=A0A0A1TCV5_9HYPO|nr:hypothetical protein VHEMI04083 [[Torrubiella] hemipterigena]